MKRRDYLLAGLASLTYALASAQVSLPSDVGNLLKALSDTRGVKPAQDAGTESGAMLHPSGASMSPANAVAADTGRFAVSTDSTEVIDNQTGLIWTRELQSVYLKDLAAGQKEIRKHAPYDKALEHAAMMSRKTGKSWRLPTVDEFSTLKVRTQAEAQANSGTREMSTLHDLAAFPNIEPGGSRYWTADTLPPRTARPRRAKAITFNPHAGGDFPYEVTLDTTEHVLVMLVRGSIKRSDPDGPPDSTR